MFGVALPEIHGQVHPLAVLLLHLVPAGTVRRSTVVHLYSYQTATGADKGRSKLSLKNLHKDVVFFHYLVEAVISSVDFVEPVIVNIRHHHLEPEQREQIRSVKDRVGRPFWYEILTFSGATPQSLVKAQHRSVTVPSLGTTTRYCEIKGETRQIKE